MILSTSLNIIRSCGTEYSAFEGIASRCPLNVMNWCLEPVNGPSNPSTRNRLMNSRRLQGTQRLILRFHIQIDVIDYRKLMP